VVEEADIGLQADGWEAGECIEVSGVGFMSVGQGGDAAEACYYDFTMCLLA
jgi:hypothetical protein